MFSNIGTPELLVVGLVLVILFGGKKLPELTHGLITSIKQFRDAYKEGYSDDEEIEPKAPPKSTSEEN